MDRVYDIEELVLDLETQRASVQVTVGCRRPWRRRVGGPCASTLCNVTWVVQGGKSLN